MGQFLGHSVHGKASWFLKQREEVKKPNQIGFREYIFPFYENPCEPWDEISADETIQGIKALK